MKMEILREAIKSIYSKSFHPTRERWLRRLDEIEARRAARLELIAQEDREKAREIMRKRRATPEGLRKSQETNREYYRRWRGTWEWREMFRESRRRHPDTGRRLGAKRRAAERALFLELRPPLESILALTSGRCYRCGAKATAVDHLIPLSRGGPEAAWNLLGICGPCNSSKSNQPLHRLPDFLGGIPHLVIANLLIHGFRHVSLPPASISSEVRG